VFWSGKRQPDPAALCHPRGALEHPGPNSLTDSRHQDNVINSRPNQPVSTRAIRAVDDAVLVASNLHVVKAGQSDRYLMGITEPALHLRDRGASERIR
jgi:hypothetical protein